MEIRNRHAFVSADEECGADANESCVTVGAESVATPQERLDAGASSGNVDAVVEAVASGADPFFDGSLALTHAACFGHVECVRLLIGMSDPKANESSALQYASGNGHVECVELLIPVSNVKAADSRALRMACQYGKLNCVRILIPVSDPKADESMSLRWASSLGYSDIVRELVPVSDPRAGHSDALFVAVLKKHLDCVEELLGVSDVELVRNRFSARGEQDAISFLDACVQMSALKSRHLSNRCPGMFSGL